MTTKMARVASVFQTMMNFHVLSGRVTERHAEIIIDELDVLENGLILRLGNTYRNRCGEEITITSLVDPKKSPYYNCGFRFRDDNGNEYRSDGTFTASNEQHRLDLIKLVKMGTTELSRKHLREVASREELVERVTQLEECLKQTRKLVSRCSINGFRDADLIGDLFANNGAITRLIPMSVEERQASQEDLGKIMAMDEKPAQTSQS